VSPWRAIVAGPSAHLIRSICGETPEVALIDPRGSGSLVTMSRSLAILRRPADSRRWRSAWSGPVPFSPVRRCSLTIPFCSDRAGRVDGACDRADVAGLSCGVHHACVRPVTVAPPAGCGPAGGWGSNGRRPLCL